MGNHLRSCLGSAVGIGWLKLRGLVQLCFGVEGLFSVHFVRADVDEPSDLPVLPASFQKRVSGVHVVDGEGETVSEGVVHVRLCGEVHHRIDLFHFQYGGHEIEGLQIPFHELEVFAWAHELEVLHACTSVHGVQNHDFILWISFHQAFGHVRPDEPCTSGEQDAFGYVLFHMSTFHGWWQRFSGRHFRARPPANVALLGRLSDPRDAS
mmetsp:Transcript_3747/g.23572  ORF Transcript_3747/g.23572 Transcript_3747/m.23572 type:complete len:209 (-) Transcript_3747:11-637(-)